MAVTVEQFSSGLCRIHVIGEMTIYTALELKDDLLLPMAQGDAIEINLAGVSEIDTAGLQLLVLVKTESQAQNKTLSLIGHSPTVLSMLELCDLEGFFGDNVLIHTPA